MTAPAAGTRSQVRHRSAPGQCEADTARAQTKIPSVPAALPGSWATFRICSRLIEIVTNNNPVERPTRRWCPRRSRAIPEGRRRHRASFAPRVLEGCVLGRIRGGERMPLWSEDGVPPAAPVPICSFDPALIWVLHKVATNCARLTSGAVDGAVRPPMSRPTYPVAEGGPEGAPTSTRTYSSSPVRSTARRPEVPEAVVEETRRHAVDLARRALAPVGPSPSSRGCGGPTVGQEDRWPPSGDVRCWNLERAAWPWSRGRPWILPGDRLHFDVRNTTSRVSGIQNIGRKPWPESVPSNHPTRARWRSPGGDDAAGGSSHPPLPDVRQEPTDGGGHGDSGSYD